MLTGNTSLVAEVVTDQVRLRWWLPKYYWIARLMRYNILKDREAAEVLSALLSPVEPPVATLQKLICGKPILVLGAGPSLDNTLSKLVELGCMNRLIRYYTIVAADGATQALLECGVTPDIVVTDLDGDLGSIITAGIRGAVIIVHGHGDNIVRLRTHVEVLKRVTLRLLGTTQVEPVYPIANFGGFTDGDRAIFIAEYFGAEKVIMIGMDFGDVIGRRSKPWLRRDVRASRQKLMKLKIAEELISWLVRDRRLTAFSVGGRPLENVKKISITEFCRVH